jgi:hypothetical protein
VLSGNVEIYIPRAILVRRCEKIENPPYPLADRESREVASDTGRAEKSILSAVSEQKAASTPTLDTKR